MKQVLVLFGLLLLPVGAWADVVALKGGGELRGVIVERRADAVVIEVGPGLVTVPMSRVTRITGGGNELAEYRARAARLAASDAGAWVALGEWAHEHGLLTQARESFERALSIDDRNERAHVGLGHVRLAGRWLTTEESYRAQGYQPFEGRWVRPEERQAILEERALEAGREMEQAESEARVREADARARAAEADARRAEADAQSGGIPLGAIYGGGIYGGDPVHGGGVVYVGGPQPGRYGGGNGARPRGNHAHQRPVPVADPAPGPPPRDYAGDPGRQHPAPTANPAPTPRNAAGPKKLEAHAPAAESDGTH